MRVTDDDTLVKPHAERVVQHIIPLLPSIVMRDPLAIRSSRDHAFDRDAHESAFLRGVQNEVADREQAEKWKSIPDAKLPAKKSSDAESHTTLIKVLADVGLASLNDLIAPNALMEMKADEQIPDGHDRTLRAKLRESLHDLSPKRDIKASYQYLAHRDRVTEAGDGDVWQVKMSRNRRRRHETRMSRDHHEEEDLALEDALGNDIRPMLEAAKRVATTKELKRIRKATAARRRAGEEVFTDEELEAANLAPPPPDAKKRGEPDWMSMMPMYLDPPSDGSQTQSPYASNDSSGSWVDIGGRIGGGLIIARVPSGSWC